MEKVPRSSISYSEDRRQEPGCGRSSEKPVNDKAAHKIIWELLKWQ